jgi:hypothetical protein
LYRERALGPSSRKERRIAQVDLDATMRTMPTMPPKSKKRKSTNPVNIDWIHSEAKKVILADLKDGHLSLDENVVSEEKAFQVYKARRPEAFADVGFDQFKLRLIDHRKQVKKLHDASLWEESAFQHDRLLVVPQGTHNHRGERIFDQSPAKELLRQDVKERQHFEMSPLDLWHSRPEYMVFTLDIFRHRIYQEERLQKYWNHLEDKRKKEEKNAPTSHRNYTFD